MIIIANAMNNSNLLKLWFLLFVVRVNRKMFSRKCFWKCGRLDVWSIFGKSEHLINVHFNSHWKLFSKCIFKEFNSWRKKYYSELSTEIIYGVTFFCSENKLGFLGKTSFGYSGNAGMHFLRVARIGRRIKNWKNGGKLKNLTVSPSWGRR